MSNCCFIIFMISWLPASAHSTALRIHVYPVDRYGHETDFYYSDGFAEIVCTYDDVNVEVQLQLLHVEENGDPPVRVELRNTIKGTVPLAPAGQYYCVANYIEGVIEKSEIFRVDPTMCSDGGKCTCKNNTVCGRTSVGKDAPDCSSFLDNAICGDWSASVAKLFQRAVCALDEGKSTTFQNLCFAVAKEHVEPLFFTSGDCRDREDSKSNEFEFGFLEQQRVPILLADHVIWKLNKENWIALPVFLRSPEASMCKLHFPIVSGTGQFAAVNATFNESIMTSRLSIHSTSLNSRLNESEWASRLAQLRCTGVVNNARVETYVHLVMIGEISLSFHPLSCDYALKLPRTCRVKMDHFKGGDVKVLVSWYSGNNITVVSNDSTLFAKSYDHYFCVADIVYTVCSTYRKVLEYRISEKLDLKRCSPENRLAENRTNFFWISVAVALVIVAAIVGVIVSCHVYHRKRDVLSCTKTSVKRDKHSGTLSG